MQSQNKFFDDLAKVLNGAAGTIAGMAREAEGVARHRTKEWVGGADGISREEFDTLKDRVDLLRDELAAVRLRLDGLEGGSKDDGSKPRKRKD